MRALVRRLSNLHEQLQPVGELELLFVDRITSCAWRLRRVIQVEAGLHVNLRHNVKKDWGRSEESIDTEREKGLLVLGRVFGRAAAGGDAFSKLARYESHIERALFRALQELQTLQAARLASTRPEEDGLRPPVPDRKLKP